MLSPYGEVFHSLTCLIQIPWDCLSEPSGVDTWRFSRILGGVFASVIDAAIAQGDPSWETKVTTDEMSPMQLRMRQLLAQNTPNLVLFDGFEHFGCHLRGQAMQGFIAVSRAFTNRWLAAKEGSEEKLGLSAILITSIHHEMGHWI